MTSQYLRLLHGKTTNKYSNAHNGELLLCSVVKGEVERSSLLQKGLSIKFVLCACRHLAKARYGVPCNLLP